jgi:hypothetical protein
MVIVCFFRLVCLDSFFHHLIAFAAQLHLQLILLIEPTDAVATNPTESRAVNFDESVDVRHVRSLKASRHKSEGRFYLMQYRVVKENVEILFFSAHPPSLV